MTKKNQVLRLSGFADLASCLARADMDFEWNVVVRKECNIQYASLLDTYCTCIPYFWNVVVRNHQPARTSHDAAMCSRAVLNTCLVHVAADASRERWLPHRPRELREDSLHAQPLFAGEHARTGK